MFFSKTTNGFYDPEIHGSKTKQITDPSWVHPKISVKLAPGESIVLNGEDFTNTGKTTVTIKDVPDPSVTAPIIEVANPDCKIPADATDEKDWEYTHAELLAGQSAGKVITSDDNGYPILTEPTEPTTEELAAAARAKRDAKLAACDWVVTKAVETGEDVPAAWKTYRQALRDITSQTGFPKTINWPEVPA